MGQHKRNPNAAKAAAGGFSGQEQRVEYQELRTQYGVHEGRVILQWNRPITNWLLTPDQCDEAVKFILEAKAIAIANPGSTPKPS